MTATSDEVRTRKRVLLVAENVTLAQVVRLATLGAALPRERYEVHFASSSFNPLVFDRTDFVQHELHMLPQAAVFKALNAGRRLYEKRTLLDYIDAELRLIDDVEPDLIVGDFRLSLSVSAELRRVPWATMINAYWSPYAVRERFPVPDHPIIKLLGEEVTERYFPKAIPKVFAHFAAPVNAVRKKYGLAEIGSLLEVLTHADFTLYPDDPELIPLRDAPASHLFLGPIQWAPNVPVPTLPSAPRPLVYATLGSSGKLDVVSTVLEALGTLPVHVVLSTAGRATLADVPRNVTVVPFAPGDVLAERASVVVSNGGSTTGYQALAAGTPVLGLPSNFDQFLTMEAIEREGAGIAVKARNATPDAVRATVAQLLDDDGSHRAAAQRLARRFARLDARTTFVNWVDSVTGGAAHLAPAPRARAANA